MSSHQYHFSLLQIIEGVTLTLNQWLEKKEDNQLKVNDDIIAIRNVTLDKKIDPETRNRVKISVKFFAYTESCTLFTSALSYFMSALNITFIDTLTISPPPACAKGSIEEMKPMWSCAVSNVKQGKIKELGVSDLDTDQLKELYEWAEETKPSTNQINLDACCVIPPEMNEFASMKEIRLLTHNDPRDILPNDKLSKLLTDVNIPNANEWKCLWVLRFSANQIANGVTDAKGYILFLTKVANLPTN